MVCGETLSTGKARGRPCSGSTHRQTGRVVDRDTKDPGGLALWQQALEA